MTFTLNISLELVQSLQAEAAQQGQVMSAIVSQLLEARYHGPVFTPERQAAWEAMLDSFSEGDAEEQRVSLDHLMHDLHEDRPGQRRVFGPGYNP